MSIANFLQTLRIALGDFDFSASVLLRDDLNILYWWIWFTIVIMACLIFLNYVIAEASASYNQVSEKLQAYIQKEKLDLVDEFERMSPKFFKNNQRMPRYIITRQVEV